LTPLAFGDAYMASEEEMTKHTSQIEDNTTSPDEADTDNEWQSQWSDEEELLTELPTSSWEADVVMFALGLLFFLSVGAILVKAGVVSAGEGVGKSKDILSGHSHFV